MALHEAENAVPPEGDNAELRRILHEERTLIPPLGSARWV